MVKNAELFGEASIRYVKALYDALAECERGELEQRPLVEHKEKLRFASVEEFITKENLDFDVYTKGTLSFEFEDSVEERARELAYTLWSFAWLSTRAIFIDSLLELGLDPKQLKFPIVDSKLPPKKFHPSWVGSKDPAIRQILDGDMFHDDKRKMMLHQLHIINLIIIHVLIAHVILNLEDSDGEDKKSLETFWPKLMEMIREFENTTLNIQLYDYIHLKANRLKKIIKPRWRKPVGFKNLNVKRQQESKAIFQAFKAMLKQKKPKEIFCELAERFNREPVSIENTVKHQRRKLRKS